MKTMTTKPDFSRYNLVQDPNFNCQTHPWDPFTPKDDAWFARFPAHVKCGNGHHYLVSRFQRGDGDSWSFDNWKEAKAKFLEATEVYWHNTVVIQRYHYEYSPYWGGDPYLTGRTVCSIESVRPEADFEVFFDPSYGLKCVNTACVGRDLSAQLLCLRP
jgi:hypothetical protein